MDAWLEYNRTKIEVLGTLSMGRLPGNDLVLNDAKISRRHALIYAHAGAYWVVDFGSRNGVFVDGRPVRQPMQMVHGSVILIGDCRLTFRQDAPQPIPLGTLPTTFAPTADAGTIFAAGGNTVMLLDDEGSIISETEQARRWLGDYYEAAESPRLPARVLTWLQQARRNNPPTAVEPLIKQVKDRRLVIRLGATAEKSWLLFLAEERPAYSIDLLQTLGLTAREAEVMHWVAEGKTNPEIARILEITVSTANRHMENIFSKLGVENRTQAMLRVLEKLGRG